MATTTFTGKNSSLLLHSNLNSTTHLRRNNHHNHHHNHHHHNLSFPKPTIFPLPPLKISPKQPLKPHFITFSSLNPSFPQPNPNSPQNPPQKSPLFLNSIKTLITLFSKIPQFITHFLNFKTLNLPVSPNQLETFQFLQDNVVCNLGPLFFASISDRPIGLNLNPSLINAVATGLAKWLDIYSGVLMVRILLSWFPNAPWEYQPFSAIRDLTDPFLNLFRKIVPPVFNSVDVSPLFAFAFLGTLGSILKVPR